MGKKINKNVLFFLKYILFLIFFSLLREKYLQNDLKQNIEDLLGFSVEFVTTPREKKVVSYIYRLEGL